MLALNLFLLVAFLLLEVFVLRRIWRKLESSSLVLLIAYSVSFVMRLINVLLRIRFEDDDDFHMGGKDSFTAVHIIQHFVTSVNLLLVFKFMIDVREVKIKLQSTTAQEYHENL